MFHVDRTAYAERFIFRFLNMFDVPETVCAVGSMVLKGLMKAKLDSCGE